MPTITEYGKQNIFANEPSIEVMENLAMMGFVAALGAYVFTGQVIPGIF